MFLTPQQLLSLLLAAMLLITGMPAFGSPYTMKGPPRTAPITTDVSGTNSQ